MESVEVEVVVPCANGQRHPIRLRIVSWTQWEIVHNPCDALLGRAFGLMSPCSHFVRESSDKLKRVVVQQLGHAGAPAIATLIDALSDENEDARFSACWALGQINDARVIPALVKALEDKNPWVRRSAAWALGQIGDAQAVPALEKMLNDTFNDLHGRYPVREAAQKALEQIRAKQQGI